jgi:peroxiredoxin
MSLINTPVQPFKTTAFVNRGGKGEFIEVSDQSLKGKWSVLIFMPAAFTFNCPTEIEDAADHYAEFQKAGAEVYIVTTDTHFSHKVWHETSPAVGKAKFPLVGDPTHTLTNAFGVHIPEEGPGAARHLHHQPRWHHQDAGNPTPTRSPATSRKRCASSRPPSTPPPTRVKCAPPSGTKAPRPWPRRWTWSARSDRPRLFPPRHPGCRAPDGDRALAPAVRLFFAKNSPYPASNGRSTLLNQEFTPCSTIPSSPNSRPTWSA